MESFILVLSIVLSPSMFAVSPLTSSSEQIVGITTMVECKKMLTEVEGNKQIHVGDKPVWMTVTGFCMKKKG